MRAFLLLKFSIILLFLKVDLINSFVLNNKSAVTIFICNKSNDVRYKSLCNSLYQSIKSKEAETEEATTNDDSLSITSRNVLVNFISVSEDETEKLSSQILTKENDNEVLQFLSLCWCVTLLSALDRVAMSVAILPLASEFGYNDVIKGEISSLFSVGYGLAIIPCGLLVARVSPRLCMAVGIALWSLGTGLTPITAGMGVTPLLIDRAVIGAAESVVLPTINRLLVNWIPNTRRSTAVAAVFSGFQMGTISAYLISPMILENFDGWRSLFYIYGCAGALLLVPWFAFAQDRPSSSTTENVLIDVDTSNINILSDIKESLKEAPWKEFAKSKAVIGITLAHAANNWGLYNNLAWTPSFYASQYGLSVRDSAFLSISPSIAGALGGFTAGWLADKLIQNNADKTFVRKLFQGIGFLGPATCLLTLASDIPTDPTISQSLLTATVGFAAFNAAGYGPTAQEKAGEKWTGLLYSVTSLPGVALGSLGVFITGKILDATDSQWDIVFNLNAFVYLCGAISFLFLFDSKKEFD